MARTDAEIDAILDLACYCDQMSVMKTQWFGPNAGRRFRVCWNNTCGYHEWVDKEEMGPRTLEIIRELQERALDREKRLRLKIGRYVERHELEMLKVKKKQQEFVAGMCVLVCLIMNMTFNTMNDVPVTDIEDHDELDF